MSNDTKQGEAVALTEYQRGFIEAILFMDGADFPPTEQQFADAIQKFADFVKTRHPELPQGRH